MIVETYEVMSAACALQKRLETDYEHLSGKRTVINVTGGVWEMIRAGNSPAEILSALHTWETGHAE